MSKNSLKLKIAYLYPDILQGFCDLMNVKTFIQRAQYRDIEIICNEINANDRIQASKYDFYYIGGSNIEQMNTVIEYLYQNKDELLVASEAKVPMLCVNCGFQLFGRFYQLNNSNKVEGVEIFNIESITGKKENYGKVVGVCEFLNNKTVVGFENHIMTTYLGEKTRPFLNIKIGNGNNKIDRTDGARYNNAIGTYITSHLLAQNPHLCDFLIATALRIKYRCRIPLQPLCDDIEWYSHKYMLEM